ncbi:MAG: RRXRR domain-containing protein, partial [Algiphilus sp.]
HPLTLKIDPGSKVTGISLVTDQDEVIWGMELEHRGELIKSALDSRRAIPQEKTRLTEANINSSQATFKGCSGR